MIMWSGKPFRSGGTVTFSEKDVRIILFLRTVTCYFFILTLIEYRYIISFSMQELSLLSMKWTKQKMIIGLQDSYSKHRFTNQGILPYEGVICQWNQIRTVLSEGGEPMR